MTIANHAVCYTFHSLQPLAIRPNGKRPLLTGWQSSDLAATLNAIASNPGANLGIAVPDGMLVLDIDTKSGGPATLAGLEATHGKLSQTLRATTATGGNHIWLTLPPGVVVGNRVAIAPGMDIRAIGGYVVAPPSAINGAEYRWDNWDTFSPPVIAEAPNWLIALANRPKEIQKTTKGDFVIPEGQRNRTLFEGAAAMRGKGFSPDAILDALNKMNANSCNPPLDDAEVVSIAASVSRYKPDAPVWEVYATPGQLPAGALRPNLASNIHFSPVSISDLYTNPPEPQRFLIDSILPGGVVTLLGAHGGSGKSTLALMATACLVTGRPFMGKATEKCRVVFYSGEDPAPVIRRRLSRICRHMDISPHELSSGLMMLDATESPTLYNGKETSSLKSLRLDVNEFNPGAVFIDNASDTYDANEIERARVREFIRLLASLGKENNAAVLLLAHIDKQTAKGGGSSEGYSGSTAWHNSARSRLFLSAKDDGLILEHQKSNLGLRSEPIYMQWTENGLLAQADAPGGINDRATILRLIGESYSRGEYISPSANATNNAYRVLQLSPEFPKRLSRQGLAAVIRELESNGMVTKETYSNGHRNHRQRYAVGAVGCVK